MDRPQMHGDQFKAIAKDMPFVAKGPGRRRYSQFWINTDVLNIRSGPSLDHDILSETYYGNLVFAYAKKGKWVAIERGFKSEHGEIKQQWVHIDYLSSNRIKEQVDSKVLEKKCSFKYYAYMDYDNFRTLPHGSNRPCAPVLKYLTEQVYLRRDHEYTASYEVWRKAQKFPEKLNKLPKRC